MALTTRLPVSTVKLSYNAVLKIESKQREIIRTRDEVYDYVTGYFHFFSFCLVSVRKITEEMNAGKTKQKKK